MKNILKKLISLFYFVINYIFFKLNNVQISNYKINGFIYLKNKGTLIIGNNFLSNSGKMHNPIGGDTVCRLIVKKEASLFIGNNVGISNSTIFCHKNITIKDNVMIGGGCRIWDSDFHSLDVNIRVYDNDLVIIKKNILIEENVFIGGGTIILKGVTIGRNSIVGAGSVVSKSIPENEIWAGNPAKYIKKITSD